MSNRVLIFLENFLPASQAFVSQQARAIKHREVAFLVSRRIPSPLEGLDQFTVHEMRASLRGQTAELLLKGPRLACPGLLPVIAESQLIHAHFGKNGFVIAPMASAAGRPLVITFHGYDATYAGDPRTPGGLNQVRFFRNGRAKLAKDGQIWSIAVSDFIRARLLSLGFRRDRVVRHYIGVDTAFFSASPQVKRVPGRVVCVSRFVEYKGHRFIIDALEKVARAGVTVELVMIGDGPLRGEIERMALRRLPSVVVLQNQSQTAVRDMLASAQAYVHGSVTLENGHAEAMGISNLEAQAVGTPAVVFDSGGVGEAILHGKTGFKTRERDVGAMADAIARLLTNSGLWAELSRNAASFVRAEFDLHRQVEDLEAIYDAVIDDHRKRGRSVH
jgi:colanic acid/amylovoran biosynthesis glycosyltransferase